MKKFTALLLLFLSGCAGKEVVAAFRTEVHHQPIAIDVRIR